MGQDARFYQGGNGGEVGSGNRANGHMSRSALLVGVPIKESEAAWARWFQNGMEK
jgi:hypothetical protein